MLFDSHNHLQSARFGKPVQEIVEEMAAAGISGCVVNATRESDWDAVAGLAMEFPGYVRPAYGVHPWFADTVEAGWEGRLRKRLEEDERSTVGEVGVDGWVDSPRIELQQQVFSKQVVIAADLGRVMTVHCLKAWEELFAAMDRAPSWPEKFLMHSFGGSIESAERLMKDHDGVMFSFSGYFLQERKHKARDVFRKLPEDRILIETDAPEMMPPEKFVEFPLGKDLNHPGNLRAIAEGLVEGMEPGSFSRIQRNSSEFWDL